MTLEIRAIPAGEPLYRTRQRLLRPTLPLVESQYPGDDLPETLHGGVFVDGELVGVGSVFRRPLPEDQIEGAWQLRGMAVLPEHQGKGYGARLLTNLIGYVAGRGGTLIWCNARERAMDLYRRHGFIEASERREAAYLGPYFVMRRNVAPDEAVLAADLVRQPR